MQLRVFARTRGLGVEGRDHLSQRDQRAALVLARRIDTEDRVHAIVQLSHPGAGLAATAGQLVPRLQLLQQAIERSAEHTSELPSLMRISYAVFCLKKKNNICTQININTTDYADMH